MQDLKNRTKVFARSCFQFCKQVPRSRELDAWVRPLLRSSGSVGASFRASQRAKSTNNFIYKLKIVGEEIDESAYWLELFKEVENEHTDVLEKLHKESKELLAITVACIKTDRNTKNSKNNN